MSAPHPKISAPATEQSHSPFPTWTGDVFTRDDLLDAINYGKSLAMTEASKIVQATFDKNLKKAQAFSVEIYQKIKSIFKINPLSMKMRVDGISSFSILIMISRADFVSDEIENIYSFLLEEMKGINKDETFHWSFTLMPQRGRINEAAILSDGYTLTYAVSPGA